MSACARSTCSNEARWRVALRLRAPAPYDDAPPVPGLMGLTVCDACKATLTLRDVLNDEGWTQILDGFHKAKRLLPDRQRTSLDFIELGGEEDDANAKLFPPWRLQP